MFADEIKKPQGSLSIKTTNVKTGKVETKDLGNNLVVNSAKAVMTHLVAQASSTGSSNLSNVVAYDPRIKTASGGGIAGGVNIAASSFNPTAAQLKLQYMAFGTNDISGDGGVSTAVDQYGLHNAVSKSGYTTESQSDLIVSNFFYGGTATVYQYLASTGSSPVDNATIRIVTRMATTEGQPAGGSITYNEAGLFTGLFEDAVYLSTTAQTPLMFARKTFADIVKTEDLELEFVWELRY